MRQRRITMYDRFRDYKVRQSWTTNCDRFWITKCDRNLNKSITKCDKFGLQIAMGLQSDAVQSSAVFDLQK